MNYDDPNMSLDDLDEQVRAALQIESSPRQLARLESFWQQRSRAERRRRHVCRAAVLAVTAVVAVAVSAPFWWPEPARRPVEANRPAPVASTAPDPNGVGAPEPAVAVQSPTQERSLSARRPPTAYERFVFAAHTLKPVTGKRPSAIAKIDEVIEQLRRDPDANARQLAESSGLMTFDAERLLLRRLSRSSDDKKHAVLQLLAVCGTPRSTSQLLRLSRRETQRDEALATLERIVTVEGLAKAVAQTPDRRVRAAIFRRLFTADTEHALDAYLSLIRDDATRAKALDVADSVSQRMLAVLLARLDDEDKAVRLSAALVLGHANGPEVTNSLIALATRKPSSCDEVWIALTACRGEQAEEFFAYATCQPQLLGQVNRARMWWLRMTL